MKIIYGIISVVFFLFIINSLSYGCDDNKTAYYNENTFQGSVKEVPLKIIQPLGIIDLGAVEPGETINPNKDAVFTIHGAKGYRFEMNVTIDMKDNQDGLLSIGGNYMLENVCSWTTIPTTGKLYFNSCNVKIPNERELDFSIKINQLKAEPGAKVGARLFKIYITASYID